MSEIHKSDVQDNNTTKGFDPDRRIEINGNDIIESYDPDRRIAVSPTEKSGKSFAERLKEVEVRNAKDKAEIVYQNKIEGCAREEKVMDQLKNQYPESQGYSIIREAYLRDKNGNIVIDKETGQARRIDFCVCKNGVVVKSIEVTSQTADKTKQLAKESRIKEQGGVYIRDANGNMVNHKVQTEVKRCD